MLGSNHTIQEGSMLKVQSNFVPLLAVPPASRIFRSKVQGDFLITLLCLQ